MYIVKFDPEALEFLEKSEKEIRVRIYNKIMDTKENPSHYWERLTARKDFKLRIGDYRAVADINQNFKFIEVTLIGHRKNVYKKI